MCPSLSGVMNAGRRAPAAGKATGKSCMDPVNSIMALWFVQCIMNLCSVLVLARNLSRRVLLEALRVVAVAKRVILGAL